MTIAAPLTLYEGQVIPEWIDINGHMNVAYYVLAFDYATDKLFDFIGVGGNYLEVRGLSMFALEAHVTYQRELHLGDPLRVTTQLLGFDAKRLHFFHRMYHGTEDFLAATSEWLGMHIDMEARRSAPFPDDISARLAEITEAHASLPRPPEVGRVIGLKPHKRE
jgi:acyl-CoA thioester hydrolase